jgi:diacylglycerol kinase family enzyme
LAGINVNIIQTEFEGQARGLVESLDGIVDAIVVAGGDGTVSEVIIRFAHMVNSAVRFCAGELH